MNGLKTMVMGVVLALGLGTASAATETHTRSQLCTNLDSRDLRDPLVALQCLTTPPENSREWQNDMDQLQRLLIGSGAQVILIWRDGDGTRVQVWNDAPHKATHTNVSEQREGGSDPSVQRGPGWFPHLDP